MQELQLDYRADRDDSGRELVGPGFPQSSLQDSEHGGGIDQVESGRHRRYGALLPRNSSKSPLSAISPSLARARSRTSLWPTSRRAAFTVSFLDLVPRTSAAIVRASWSISTGVFTMVMSSTSLAWHD